MLQTIFLNKSLFLNFIFELNNLIYKTSFTVRNIIYLYDTSILEIYRNEQIHIYILVYVHMFF